MSAATWTVDLVTSFARDADLSSEGAFIADLVSEFKEVGRNPTGGVFVRPHGGGDVVLVQFNDGSPRVRPATARTVYEVTATAREIMEAHIAGDDAPFYPQARVGELELVTSHLVEHRRWSVVTLHTYRHTVTGEMVGVLEEVGATENQFDEGGATVVDVAPDESPHYVVVS